MEWLITNKPVPYDKALSFMEKRVEGIKNGTLDEAVWLLEHPDLYTGGTSAQTSDLLKPTQFPVYETGRGGQYTYHGPGQRIAYTMINLKNRDCDVRRYVNDLEEWIILSLRALGVNATRRNGRVGIWITRKNGNEDKIAAIGIRIRKWITFHGISINVAPNLDHYNGIIACGLNKYGVTSLADLEKQTTMLELDHQLRLSFSKVFNVTPDRIKELTFD